MMHNLEPKTGFLKRLETSLNGDLPGEEAHLEMASRLRREELNFSNDLSKATKSSVLILLYPEKEKIKTCFILRQTYKGVHSGQVSFPGGRYEKEDNTLISTALREAHEEVNIDPQKVSVLGTLSELFIPPSNYIVLPVVGYTDTVPEYIAENSEVAQIITTDLDFLFDKKQQKEKVLHVRGTEIHAPYYDVKGHVVWGATAMILSELKHVIKSIT